jgi:hypothetical protein
LPAKLFWDSLIQKNKKKIIFYFCKNDPFFDEFSIFFHMLTRNLELFYIDPNFTLCLGNKRIKMVANPVIIVLLLPLMVMSTQEPKLVLAANENAAQKVVVEARLSMTSASRLVEELRDDFTLYGMLDPKGMQKAAKNDAPAAAGDEEEPQPHGSPPKKGGKGGENFV